MGTKQENNNASTAKKRKNVCLSDDEFEDANWPKFIVLACKDQGKDITRISPFLIEKSLKAAAGDVKNVKKLNHGLLIECQRKVQSDNILKMNKIYDHEITASPHRTLNQSKGIIRYKGGDLDELKDEEICNELKPQGVKAVKRFTTKRENTVIKLNTFLLTFNTTTVPSNIHIGPYFIKVSTYIPNPVRCFKCQKFGHGKGQCKGHENCFRCSEEGHDGMTCSKTIKCFNCKGAHMSSSKDCPIYKKEKEILKIKTEKNITYQEARQQHTAFVNSLPSSQNTYASVAKRAFTSTETQTVLTWKVDEENMTKLPVDSSEKVLTPSEKVIRQIEKARLQSSQSSQTTPSQPTSSKSSIPASSKSSTPAASNSSSENKKSEKKKNKQKQKNNKPQKMDTDSESDTTAWGDPMETLSSDRERSKSRSPGRRQDRERQKISPIRPPK